MKRNILGILPVVALAAACADQSPTSVAAPEAAALATSAGGNGYVVVLKEGADPRSVAAIAGVHPRHVYSAALNGFSADLTQGQYTALQRNPNVAYVEADAQVQLFGTQTTLYSWGIDRVDQRQLPLSTTFSWVADGLGANVYVLDTGIRLSHLDFTGRAAYIPNGSNGDFVGDGHGSAADCHGHGSHVAGTAVGTYSGVAKGAFVYAGRVVNCNGGGNVSMAIAAVDWITANGVRPAVVNMSLGYGNVQSLRDAVENSVAAGVNYAVAAGNGNFGGIPQDACSESPAGAPNAITTGSTTSSDSESSFSNYGTCVKILAPGSSITSSSHTVDNGLVTMSGTSMASPHTAGVVAQYLSVNPLATPSQVMNELIANSTKNVISLHSRSRRGNTPNRLLYTNY
jgi:subtilisin family serine protease